MGSYGSQSVASIGAMMEYEAKLKKQEQQKYRMPDNQVVTVILPVGIIRKVAREEVMTFEETSQFKSAMQHALWDER